MEYVTAYVLCARGDVRQQPAPMMARTVAHQDHPRKQPEIRVVRVKQIVFWPESLHLGKERVRKSDSSLHFGCRVGIPTNAIK